ncbi:M15 family metallopeptidase [Phenylobacterium sp.]|uniref:M15 family metallopeptidase n=1 Tax=Phenylobacterium sp. TaxID=1871053 RepID=UPI002F3E5E7E
MPLVKLKAQPTCRFRGAALALALAATLPAASCAPRAPSPITAPETPPARPAPSRAPNRSPPSAPPAPAPPLRPAVCGPAAGDPASAANALSLNTLAWAPFRRPETGWETYAPLIGQEIGSPCAPDTPGFAAALSAWQDAQGLPGGGRMSEAAFQRMKARWQDQRPFVRAAHGACPAPPAETTLAPARISESYLGKPVVMRPAVLAAYRRLAAAARQDLLVRADPRNLTIFSAYRSPQADAERCRLERNCDGVGRATCSPHRTGLALDLFVGAAPGFGPDSSAEANRRFQSKTAVYRWLVRNAGRFGFSNYPFEPWHWEWTGEAP